MSLNLARRHLNSSQCAFVALEVERVLAEEAKERQVENGKNNALNLTQFQESRNVEKIPQSGITEPEEKSRDKASTIVGNTNARYVQDAKKIERVLAEEAKERQVEAGKEFGRGQEKLVEKIPQAIAQEADPKSREKAASIIGHRVRQYCRTPINNRGLYARDG